MFAEHFEDVTFDGKLFQIFAEGTLIVVHSSDS